MRTSAISFGNNEKRQLSQDEIAQRKKKAEGAVVGTGAAAAASKKAGFNIFKSSKKIGMLTNEATDTMVWANKPIRQTRSLFGRFGTNAKGFTSKILNWTENLKKSRFIKPLLESRLFLGAATFLGTGLAVLTLITGCVNICRATSVGMQNRVINSEYLNSLEVKEDKETKSRD